MDPVYRTDERFLYTFLILRQPTLLSKAAVFTVPFGYDEHIIRPI